VTDENHVATAQDFQRAQDLGRPVERIMLPQLGKGVLMRRPSPRWFLYRGQLPATLAAEVSGATKAPASQIEDLKRFARWIVELLGEVMIQPRVSATPGPGEISSDLISDEDLNFIIKWSMGAVAPDGRDLAPFRGERESADPGADCGGMALPAERPAAV
jgi:hypothetical protein